MKPFSSNRTKRNTAFVALFVWLFALASGMANACLLETPATHTHAHALEVPSFHAVDVTPALPEQVADAADHQHHDKSDVSKEACLKTCDDGSNAPAKLKVGFDLTNPGSAFIVAPAWNAVRLEVPARRRLDELRIPLAGPPLRVRYSRLAL